ncbi:hypothetical protein BS17DRAFT_716002, partial [Gyrodon lividus]
YDCAFVTTNPDLEGMRGMDVVCVLGFFSFVLHGEQFPCAVVCWLIRSEEPDEDTGMWIVCPGFNIHHQPNISIIHLNTIYCFAHLIPIYRTQEIFNLINPIMFFVLTMSIKFADHHAFEIAS